jgi:NodT family efflux transporter outer membrane factor (OMF) lipoprotein
LGATPSEVKVPAFELADLKLPQELPLSVPSKLVEQRPDIRASEATLHQASADIGVATAAQFPAFNLSGGIESATTQFANSPSFFTPDSFAWSIAANVAAPIFHGGALDAQKPAAVFAYDRANAQYRGTVLNAFADVANVLAALQLDAETLRVQLYAEQTAEQSLQITQERFQAGAIAYLALLDAQRTYQQARIALVIAQANRYADTVALFQSLGGGWWNRQDVIQASNTNPAMP